MGKTVVFDVDGTICFDGVSIAPAIAEALSALRGRFRLVFASARPIRDLLPVLPAEFHDETLVGGNGAFSRSDGELQVLGIAREDRRVLDRIIDEHDLKVLIDGDWDYAYTGDEAHKIFRQLDAGKLASNVSREQIERYSKVVLFTSRPDVLRRLRETGLSISVHPEEGIVDVAPSGITKHHALVRLGIAESGYTAFGNDANDERMLREATTSYCVGRHPALAFADRHLAPEAVPRAIRDLLEPERDSAA
ncbi:HAD-IIB family hydrolase [Amycolatopsis rubida]|uniref:HAD-IIB family hydrolase n=1 Tax=Amycolatopsis rubida TaxID=112413 RepID=A0ABX0C0F5_9PSEU|nr:HAD-IIB family hydrolase [Amycolatopsis sp. M39]MYW95799.1 HAD-IIB family hydrolase [Amycolatopsis rubida]NEC60789.1 HAD-IIB family hydrolase [Amycolatopsis rubida]